MLVVGQGEIFLNIYTNNTGVQEQSWEGSSFEIFPLPIGEQSELAELRYKS